MSTRTSALDTVVFGVDIQSGDVRGDSPSYALVVFNGEEIERDVVTQRKLRRLIDQCEPAFVATDNMYELAADKEALIRFLEWLPDDTRLIQVTGDERPEPLSRVASRHGVPYGKDPMQEAEAAARLAAHNVGYEVSAFTDTTAVKVARGRVTGKGGWSEDRYTRRIHGAVKRRARAVESALEEAGLSYEVEITEKYGGYANAVFMVEAGPSDIPVSRGRSGDVRVEIERQRRDGLEFEPLAKRRGPVIVGIDPGTTTAVAVLDLEGDPLDQISTRTADTAEIVEWLIERGRPVLIAADVTPMPQTVEQFRRSFEAAGWTPERDLPIDEKKHRTRNHGYDDDHERDALAAALFAFDAYQDQIERVIKQAPPQIDTGELVTRVIANEEPIEAAIEKLEPEQETDDNETEHVVRELSPQEQRIQDLERQVERLESHISELKATIDKQSEELADYEDALADARREERRDVRERRSVTRLEREIDRLERDLDAEQERSSTLEEKLERLKELWKLDHSDFDTVSQKADGELVVVKPIEQFTADAIDGADSAYGLAEDDVLYIRDASGAGRQTAEQLAAIQPRVVLKQGGLSDVADKVLFENDIPVGPAEQVAIQEVDELAVARESDVVSVIREWEERAEVRRRDQNVEMVDRVISEHRADRRDVPPGELLDS